MAWLAGPCNSIKEGEGTVVKSDRSVEVGIKEESLCRGQMGRLPVAGLEVKEPLFIYNVNMFSRTLSPRRN